MSKLQEAIDEMNEKYYFVGDDCHNYAFCCIDKELGDLLIKKYPDFINSGGIRIKPIQEFDIAQTDFDNHVDFKELWEEYLKYDEEISWDKGYKTFEDFIEKEGFDL